MATGLIECVTLDSDSGDEAPQRVSVQEAEAREPFVRCNLCVDPGLLPARENQVRKLGCTVFLKIKARPPTVKGQLFCI